MATVTVTNNSSNQIAVGNFIIKAGLSKDFISDDFLPWEKGLPSSLSADIQALQVAGHCSVLVDGVAASGDALAELPFVPTKPSVRLTQSIVAATADNSLLFVATQDLVVVSVEFVPDVAVTANDTNYADLSVDNETATSVVAANSTTTGDTASLVAYTAFVMTLTDTVVTQGDVISATIGKQGTGVVVTGTFVLTANPV